MLRARVALANAGICAADPNCRPPHFPALPHQNHSQSSLLGFASRNVQASGWVRWQWAAPVKINGTWAAMYLKESVPKIISKFWNDLTYQLVYAIANHHIFINFHGVGVKGHVHVRFCLTCRSRSVFYGSIFTRYVRCTWRCSAQILPMLIIPGFSSKCICICYQKGFISDIWGHLSVPYFAIPAKHFTNRYKSNYSVFVHNVLIGSAQFDQSTLSNGFSFYQCIERRYLWFAVLFSSTIPLT